MKQKRTTPNTRARGDSFGQQLLFGLLVLLLALAALTAQAETAATRPVAAVKAPAAVAQAPAKAPAMTTQAPARKAPAATAPMRASPNQHYQVALYQSAVIPLAQTAKRVSVGNPGIADILILRSRQLYVVGKALGSTNVTVWDAGENIFANYIVEVTHDLGTLKLKLHQLLPGEDIKVYSAQEQLVLSGQVSSAVRMNAARDLAMGFLPECIKADSNVVIQDSSKAVPVVIQQGGASSSPQGCKQGQVVNMLQVGGAQQVMLKITVAEMARDLTKVLDSDLSIMSAGGHVRTGVNNGGASFPNALDAGGLAAPVLGGPGSPIGPPVSVFQPALPSIDNSGFFFSYLNDGLFLQAVLDVSRRNGLAKILSEPTLTTLTGQEAQFLSGGEFPIPVPQGGTSNATTIEFKEFGVGVKFLPVVLDSGHINLTLNVSVSELSTDNRVALATGGSTSAFLIPSLTKRSASSTVELADGQTIGIAGLINDNVREFVDKFPGLGDIPLLGALFRSQEFRSGQTELVIFVTPHLAKPMSPQSVRLPTDSFVPPEDLEFYLMGRMEAKEGAKPQPVAPSVPRKTGPSHFGHDM